MKKSLLFVVVSMFLFASHGYAEKMQTYLVLGADFEAAIAIDDSMKSGFTCVKRSDNGMAFVFNFRRFSYDAHSGALPEPKYSTYIAISSDDSKMKVSNKSVFGTFANISENLKAKNVFDGYSGKFVAGVIQAPAGSFSKAKYIPVSWYDTTPDLQQIPTDRVACVLLETNT